MREKVALLEGLEEAFGAVEHHLVCVRRVLPADVNLVRGRLDARVAAVRTLVLLLPRVPHLVTAEGVVVPAPVVAYITPEIGKCMNVLLPNYECKRSSLVRLFSRVESEVET